MPLLYHWRGDNYRRDLDEGAAYHLNQKNPLLHEIGLGDSLWAFTRRKDGAYVLAAELVVSLKTLNHDGYKYGPYRLWGDLGRSRYFDVVGQPDITALVRGLSITARGDVLGRAFQGNAAVRRITEQDHQVLAQYAKALELEPRAGLVPEEAIEALLGRRDAEDGLARLLSESGLAEERAQHLITLPKRSHKLVGALRELYGGRCQICAWDPPVVYGTGLCEAHHVRWLSRGGSDDLSNLALLCPNHHRAVYRCDAQFDWEDHAFVFGGFREPLRLLEHELRA